MTPLKIGDDKYTKEECEEPISDQTVGDKLDKNIRQVAHAHHRVVVEIGLLDGGVVDADLFSQCQTEAVDDVTPSYCAITLSGCAAMPQSAAHQQFFRLI